MTSADNSMMSDVNTILILERRR